jgi:RNA 3'-terminal phosphate cyclase (ATP)
MLTLDGSFGEGGGQILRSALALSLITKKGFCVENIRANRKNPGLRRQHATAVRAAGRIGSARLEGAKEGSKRLVFEPQQILPGHYRFTMGTAGSTTLVLQTIIPPLIQASGPSTILLEGGTHNPMAPPFGFIDRVFLPLLRRMGAKVEAELEKPGFYPKGGGKLRIQIDPVPELRRLDLMTRGDIIRTQATAIVSNLPRAIANRELNVCRRKLSLKTNDLIIEELDSKGPGNVIYLEVESERLTELFVGFGEKRVKAETVADNVIKKCQRYLAADDIPVGEHLADQLLIPLALAGGGSFKTFPLSAHTTTNIHTIKKFLDVEIHVIEDSHSATVIIEA